MSLLRSRTAFAVALSLIAFAAPSAFAQDDAVKPSSLGLAADKWEQGLLTEAAPLYERALEEGGMYPSDVVVAYARIGTVAAASGKKEAALSAFRVAAVIDPAFQLPAESGPIAKRLYEDARKAAQKQGGKLEVTLETPDKVDAGKGFTVTAKLPEAFAPVVDKVGIEVKDTLAKNVAWKGDQPATESMTFEVPGKVVQGGTTLLVRVSALDPHANRWAIKEARVKVTGRAEPVGPVADETEEKPPEEKGGSFWSSPWPYAIGGAVVVGAVATFFLTRPVSTVNVGAPSWR